MNEYYGGGWSASKLKLYFWLTVIGCVVVGLLEWAGVIEMKRPKSKQQVERERQTGKWER